MVKTGSPKCQLPSRALPAGCAASSCMAALPQMHEQQRDGRRGEPGNAGGLPQGFRTHIVEPLPNFVRQTAQTGVVEIIGQPQGFVPLLPIDFFRLALEVSRILRLHLDLLLHLLTKAFIRAPLLGIESVVAGGNRRGMLQIVEAQVRPAQQIQSVRLAHQVPAQLFQQCRIDVLRMYDGGAEARNLRAHGGLLALKELPALIVDQTEFPPDGREA